jgi:hypothetical protein
MQTTPRKLHPAQDEVHQAAHKQELTEVPRRAMLDREGEGRRLKHSRVEPVEQDK